MRIVSFIGMLRSRSAAVQMPQLEAMGFAKSELCNGITFLVFEQGRVFSFLTNSEVCLALKALLESWPP